MQAAQAQRRSEGGEAAARVRLVRGADAARDFQPLTPSREVELDLAGLGPELLDRLDVSGEVELVPGSHRLPVFADDVLPVEIARETRCRYRVRARRRGEGAQAATVVDLVELSFEPALVLHDIVPVLVQLPTLFEDRQLAPLVALLSRAQALKVAGLGLGDLGDWLGRLVQAGLGTADARERMAADLRRMGERLRGQVGELASVSLERLTAEPVLSGGTWLLEPRFCGQFVLLGQVPVPFKDVHLPHPVLPAPHADLARMSAEEPLATARLKTGGLRAEALADPLAALVWSLSGTLELEGRLPPVELDALLPDGGLLDLKLRAGGELRARVSFLGRVARDEAALTLVEVEVGAQGRRLAAQGTLQLSRRDAARDPGRGLAARLVEAARARRWRDPGLAAEAVLRLRAGSQLPDVDVAGVVRHPELNGGIEARATVSGAGAHGEVRLALEEGRLRAQADAGFEASLEVHPGGGFDDNRLRVVPQVAAGRVSGRLKLAGADAQLELHGALETLLRAVLRMEAFPELLVDEGDWRGLLPAQADFHLRGRLRTGADGLRELDFSGSRARAVLGEVRAEMGRRSLAVPAGAVLDLALGEGVLAASGLGRAVFDLAWDLQGRSPVLRHGEEAVEVLVPALVRRAVTVELSPAGGLSVTGDKGDLFDAAFFNALLNPGADPQRALEILDDDKTMDRVLRPLRVFSPEIHDWAQRLRRFAKKARRALEAEGIRTPGDAIPGRKLARIASRLLSDGPELEDRVHPLVKSVTDGQGLDVRAVKRLVNDVVGDHEWQYELDRVVRWLARLLAPTERLAPWQPAALPPLEHEPAQRERLARIPSARDLYRAVDAPGPLAPEMSAAIARVAPYLSLEQLEYLLSRGRADWGAADLARLRLVRELMKRVQLVEDSYGGIAFAPQSHAIAFFLAETLALSEAGEARWADGFANAGSLLGPEDVATLLQAGLATLVQGRTVQRNQRMLLAHVFSRPPEFLREVLVELARGSSRVLAGALNALLNLEQSFLREPFDLPGEFGARLGLELPRLDDYLAGGRRAGRSYFEALSEAAERILAEAGPYLALRSHVRIDRDPPGTAPMAVELPDAQRRAQDAIAEADAQAARWDRAAGDEAGRGRAAAAYEAAFQACRDLLAQDPRAFQRPWLKEFWGRNHEALVVRSVVRGVQEDLDRDRRWLEVRTQAPVPQDEQALLEAVVGALYHGAEDRARLLADPLVRLLLEPPAGRYDFTIVTCMGVITEGARGHELDTACERLERRRGIRTIRADTATMRSLEYNAQRIEEAVRQARTPWGWVGYSQGCANGLCAESRLLGGTPAQQALASRLVARNLLFSAFNGSAHGTCSDWKYLRAMVDGERILKHYQAVMSRPAIEMGLAALRRTLDSRGAVVAMLGSFSLSHDGVLFLQREGRFRDDVPTSLVRGIVEPETLPEALEWLAHVLTVQAGTDAHDTQVIATEAVGSPLRVRNDAADALARCDMGCLVQRTHHWSPLVKETEFVTTESDRRRAIYDFPKDRHVAPWVEVNARFGRIRVL